MLSIRERGGRGGADPTPRALNVPGGPGTGRERNPGAGPGGPGPRRARSPGAAQGRARVQVQVQEGQEVQEPL